jgi:hypothetical protein
MGGNMVRFVALDLVLRMIRRRLVSMAFVVEIRVTNPDDPAGYPTGLGIPAHMIADSKLCHANLQPEIGLIFYDVFSMKT